MIKVQFQRQPHSFGVPAVLCKPVDRTLLPNPKAHDAVRRWIKGEEEFAQEDESLFHGLVLVGAPGTGKTRALLDALRSPRFDLEEINDQKTGEYLFVRMAELISYWRELMSPQLYKEVSVGYETELDRFIDKMKSVTFLCFDDFDKIANVRAREIELLLDVIDERLHTEWFKTIFTLNARGQRLLKKLSGWEDSLQEEAAAIVDRLNPARGLCTLIDFDADYHAISPHSGDNSE